MSTLAADLLAARGQRGKMRLTRYAPIIAELYDYGWAIERNPEMKSALPASTGNWEGNQLQKYRI